MLTHPTDEQLNDYFDRALSPADHVAIARHLEGCPDCSSVVDDLQHLVGGAATLEPMAPPERAWTRIEQQLGLTHEGLRQEGLRAEGLGLRGRTKVNWRPVWALATAALIVLAFLTGRFVEHRTAEPARTAVVQPQGNVVGASTAATGASNVRERVLLIAVGDHLDRSQMVLVELANAQPREQFDISAEQESADELLASNRLYRQAAAQIGQNDVADVLGELERVLVEVARGPSRLSVAQLAAIQQRIEAQGILFKVKVIRNNAEYR